MVEVTEELKKQCLSDRNPADHLHWFLRWVASQTHINDKQYRTLNNIFDLIPYRRQYFIVVDDELIPAKREETQYRLTATGFSTCPRPQRQLKNDLKKSI